MSEPHFMAICPIVVEEGSEGSIDHSLTSHIGAWPDALT